MYTLSPAQAVQLAAQQANNNTITPIQVAQQLGNASVTFARIEYVTKVQTAAAFKGELIQKVTVANVILASSLKAHTSVYANKVKRTASAISSNDQAAVEAFTPAANYFEHTACHCLVQHKQDASKYYLYAMYNNNSKSLYIHNGNVVTEQDIVKFLTPSAAKALADKSGTVRNVTHNITHSAVVRTIALSNIVSIKARKRLVTV